MSTSIKLSVVIPAFNESVNIKQGALEAVERYLKAQKYSWEVIIVDDGSSDDTVALIERCLQSKKNFHLICNSHGGKALTVTSGMLQAKGEIVLFTDMDQATPLNQIEKFFPKFAAGFNIVIGSRSGRKGAPLVRKLAAWVFAGVRNLVLGLPFSDTQCGFKAFDSKAVQVIFPQVLQIWKGNKARGGAVNAGFDVETLFLAKKLNFKIAEVPVVWHHVGTERVQLINDSLEAIKDILRIRAKDFQGTYA